MVLRWAEVDADGVLTVEAVERAMTRRTRLVAVTPISNVVGTPTPLAAIAAAVHARGVPILADDRIAMHEQALSARARACLSAVKGLRILSGQAAGPIVTFVVDGVHPHDLATLLDAKGICIRAGSHCAQPLHARYGITASARASFGLYTSVEEIDRLGDAVGEAATLLA